MSSNKHRVYFCTLGCPKNQVDTEVMAKQALGSGAEITRDPSRADTIVVNTCAFLQASQEESVDRILDLSEHRKAGACQNFVVTGCLPSRNREDLVSSLPEVDHFLGTNDLHLLKDLLTPQHSQLQQNLVSLPEKKEIPDYVLGDRFADGGTFSRYLKIAEGCDRSCSFCIIPAIRGPQKSRAIESLVEEAKQLVDGGAKEINLIAQDLTAYGHDLSPNKRLEDLLEELVTIRDLHWLRCHYIYPQRISDRLIDLFSNGLPLLPYMDMPLQHISTRILQLMKRGTTSEKQHELIAKLRQKIPGLILRTTLIVGFPGETEAEFAELLDFIEAAQFDHLGAFAFSQEPGTTAAELSGQLPEEVKQERWHRLMAKQKEIARQKNSRRIGQELEVLVEGPSRESDFLIEARGTHQAPEIDGVTYITDLGPNPRPLSAGDLVRIRVDQTHDYDLAGALVLGS